MRVSGFNSAAREVVEPSETIQGNNGMYSPKSKVCPRLLPPRLFLKFTFLLLERDPLKYGKHEYKSSNSRGGKSRGQTFDFGE